MLPPHQPVPIKAVRYLGARDCAMMFGAATRTPPANAAPLINSRRVCFMLLRGFEPPLSQYRQRMPSIAPHGQARMPSQTLRASRNHLQFPSIKIVILIVILIVISLPNSIIPPLHHSIIPFPYPGNPWFPFSFSESQYLGISASPI